MSQRKRTPRFVSALALAALALAALAPRAAAQIRIEIPGVKRPKAEAPKAPPPGGESQPVRTAAGGAGAKAAAADDEQQRERRKAFREEIGPYFVSVRQMAGLYDPKFKDNTLSGPNNEGDWAKVRKDLEAVDNLCRTKYAGITDEPKEYLSSLQYKAAAICAIAARRDELEKRSKSEFVVHQYRSGTLFLLTKSVKDSLEDRDGLIPEQVQKMLFERDAWKREAAAQARPKFAEAALDVPADLFAPVETLLDELQAHIEKTAPARKWEQPGNSDPQAEAYARQRIAAEYKGAQILKIGSSYNGWRTHKNSLGIPTNQYKRGWVLLKIPGRPHCQAREWMMKQEYLGGGRWSATKWDGLGSHGIFMPCN
jgi:hypothetical protein